MCHARAWHRLNIWHRGNTPVARRLRPCYGPCVAEGPMRACLFVPVALILVACGEAGKGAADNALDSNVSTAVPTVSDAFPTSDFPPPPPPEPPPEQAPETEKASAAAGPTAACGPPRTETRSYPCPGPCIATP